MFTKSITRKLIFFMTICLVALLIGYVVAYASETAYRMTYNDGYCTKCGSRLTPTGSTWDDGEIIHTFECSSWKCWHRVALPDYWYNKLV